jgi:Na+/H+ antiporter NhaC
MLSGGMMPVLLPVLTFLLSALIAFSTGSSWGSMAILYPLMLPATWQVCLQNGLDQETMMMIFYNVVSCVLAGSVLGDHCSPISDTTILSSIATSCDHIEHVRTQLPYALTVGVVSVLCGVLPAAMGLPSSLAFIMGLAVLFCWVRFFGKKVE